jgi:hypothetical protein
MDWKALGLKIAAYAVTPVAVAAAGGWNPFPPGSIQYQLVVPVAGLAGVFLGLVLHPNGVNGPAKTKKLPTPAAGGFARLGLLMGLALLAAGCLFLARPAAAQESTGPLTVQLTPDLSLHPNITVAGFAYDLSHKNFMGQVQFTGLYVLDYKQLVGVGLGASFRSNDNLESSLTAMVASPSIKLTPTTRLRAGLLAQYRWLGNDHGWVLAGAPTLEF